jgi:hypothetical protein
MKIGIDAEHSPTGWIGLALSAGGIVLFVLAAVFLWIGANRPPQGNCTFDANGSTCTYAQYPGLPDPLVFIGLVGLVIAPCLSVAGWKIGNRRAGLEVSASEGAQDRPDRAPLGQAIAWVLTGPAPGGWKIDGPSVGKAGLIFMALVVLAAAGASAVLTSKLGM